MPQRIGRNSITTRCAMCAEGRNATVASSGPMGSTEGPISMLETMAWCVTSAIFGSPVAPEVRYRTAGSSGRVSARWLRGELRIARHGFAPHLAQIFEREHAFGPAGQQDPVADGGILQLQVSALGSPRRGPWRRCSRGCAEGLWAGSWGTCAAATDPLVTIPRSAR